VTTNLLARLLCAVRRTTAVGEADELTDRGLLRRFADERDEAAFAELMRRHGPMVLGVCRRVLDDPNDADDAFQATFLVLARKAGSVGRPDRLAGWLYGVALRIVRKMRANTAHRRARQRQMTDLPGTEPGREADWDEVRGALDDEVQRLPEKFRQPVLLCYLEGRTREEAARQLGWSAGAVKGMLERGRELLRSRLTRRGVTVSATALAGMLSEKALSAAVPGAISEPTIKAALQFAAGRAAAGAPAALAEGAIQAMRMNKVKAVVAAALVVAVLGTGAGVLALQGQPEGPKAPTKEGPAARADEKAELLRKNAAARLDLAQSAYAGYLLRFQFGMENEQTVTLWSRRWLQAQLDLSDRKADRDAALQAHQDRLKKVDEIARARLELGNYLRPKTPDPVRPFEDNPKDHDTVLKEEFEGVWGDYMNRKVNEERVCHASVCWLVGQQWYRKLAKKAPLADPKDLQAHLERIKKVEEIATLREAAGAISGIELGSVLFYRHQAEEWVARGKTFTDDVLNPGGEK
jgi:RNA polymerase sigma factor (sigma-70 family)